jgi:hypothetical protein
MTIRSLFSMNVRRGSTFNGKVMPVEESAMKWRSRRAPFDCVTSLLALSLTLLAAGPATANDVNFDNVAASPTGTAYPGNTFAAQGVVFSSVSSPSVVFPGKKISLTNAVPRILIVGNDNHISPPNFAAASGAFSGGPNDVLMSFSSPVTSVEVVTDDTSESPDVVRLIALAPAGAGSFVVVKMATKLDNATSPPGNVLSLDLQGKPVSFVLFQATTEAEGFDDLAFDHAPDCTGHRGPIDLDCFELPLYDQWIRVGCEIVDCPPWFFPGDMFSIDWFINVDGEKFDTLVLQFADLARETAAGLVVEGNATWHSDEQQLELHGPGQVILRGLVSEKTGLRWSAASPRMTLDRIDAPAGTGASRALRVKVKQQVGEQAISDSTLVYGF